MFKYNLSPYEGFNMNLYDLDIFYEIDQMSKATLNQCFCYHLVSEKKGGM